jgi:UDP-N-acetylmuramoyl-L-alanyl-D-glutamate--2,6-diaminopimelate ligase
MRGAAADGNAFVADAIRRGARVVVSEAASRAEVEPGVTWVQVSSAREALAELAGQFFGHPTRRLCLVGITGTNGKTTTAHLVASVLEAAGFPVAVLGTVGHRGPGFTDAADLTTPEAPDLERRFREAVAQGGTHAVMEVSSHALAMRRVWGLEFDVGVFTNLSGDHLDFHGDMEAYFETKRLLFTGAGSRAPALAVVNADDPYGQRLLDGGVDAVLTFGSGKSADVFPTSAEFGWDGLGATFRTPRGSLGISSPLIGRSNLMNVAAAVGVAVGLHVPDEAIAEGVRALGGVPGRFEQIDRGQEFRVVVDYAHTDDALRQTLRAIREMTPGRVIVVFGAGGGRDVSKRKRMGGVAAGNSDLQIVTSDNPRNEDPAEIIAAIVEGMPEDSGNYSTVPDRRAAIGAAIREARAGDTVVIAGKGHEDYQWVGTRRLPFDDRVVAGEWLDETDARRDR